MKKISILFILFIALGHFKIQAQEIYPYSKRPKLVVGIVVDQMRYDYITRFWNHYGDGGIKKLVNNGFNVVNGHFNYMPTYTGPGHASVFTGGTPSYHGIISNSWFDKKTGESMYCVEDNDHSLIANKGKIKGDGVSPKNLLVPTIADKLMMNNQYLSKSFGISIKDRGAVLPIGRTGNGAFWFHGKDLGQWISSSYYYDKLPEWVIKFNKSDIAKKYLNQKWKTIKDISTYKESYSDNNSFERGFKGKDNPTFDYDLKKLKKENGNFDLLKSTPFGNSLITDFALSCIKAENLGKGDLTDFLSIGYSSTDSVGHNFGVDSKEVQDTYIRLDLELKKLIDYLDSNLGKEGFTIFLTSDHGAVHVPNLLKSKKLQGGYFNKKKLNEKLSESLKSKFGVDNLIRSNSNYQIFLDHNLISEKNISLENVKEFIISELKKEQDISYSAAGSDLEGIKYDLRNLESVKNGFHQERSGDIIYILKYGIIDYPQTGSTHGSTHNYDTHAPIIFYGKGIVNGGITYDHYSVTDIAPTISVLLGIEYTGSGYKVIKEAFKD